MYNRKFTIDIFQTELDFCRAIELNNRRRDIWAQWLNLFIEYQAFMRFSHINEIIIKRTKQMTK